LVGALYVILTTVLEFGHHPVQGGIMKMLANWTGQDCPLADRETSRVGNYASPLVGDSILAVFMVLVECAIDYDLVGSLGGDTNLCVS
jgi:hypothetical protein